MQCCSCFVLCSKSSALLTLQCSTFRASLKAQAHSQQGCDLLSSAHKNLNPLFFKKLPHVCEHVCEWVIPTAVETHRVVWKTRKVLYKCTCVLHVCPHAIQEWQLFRNAPHTVPLQAPAFCDWEKIGGYIDNGWLEDRGIQWWNCFVLYRQMALLNPSHYTAFSISNVCVCLFFPLI